MRLLGRLSLVIVVLAILAGATCWLARGGLAEALARRPARRPVRLGIANARSDPRRALHSDRRGSPSVRGRRRPGLDPQSLADETAAGAGERGVPDPLS